MTDLDSSDKEDREVASWLVDGAYTRSMLRTRIISALASVREASRVEERAAVVAWGRHQSKNNLSWAYRQIADEIERGAHLTLEKGDG